jgi:hypothetical protein
MLKKYLEKKVQVLPSESVVGYRSSMELEYYLTESDNFKIEDTNENSVFGIEIIKKVDDIDVEVETIKNFSCCREETKHIVEKLADNLVTPVGLYFVLDDILGI